VWAASGSVRRCGGGLRGLSGVDGGRRLTWVCEAKGVEAEQDVVNRPVDVDGLVERLGIVLVAGGADERLVEPAEVGVAEGGVVALVLERAGPDRGDGEEALVVKQRPVERDENVQWEDVLEPRPGGGRGDEEKNDGKKDQDQVEAVEEGVENKGKRGGCGGCVWGRCHLGVECL